MAFDFGINLNALGPPTRIDEWLSLASPRVTSYPDIHFKEARKALSKFLSLPEECFSIGSGATDFILEIPLAMDRPSWLLVEPSFWEYRYSLSRLQKLFSITTHVLDPAKGFALFDGTDSLESKIPDHGAVFFCNPNNPTSTFVKGSQISELASRHPGTLFVVDETYLPFLSDYKELTVSKDVIEHDNIISICSLSKIFAVPGLRLGFAAGHPKVISAITQKMLPYGVNTIAESVLPHLLGSSDYLVATQEYYEVAIPLFFKRLVESTSSFITWHLPSTCFVLGNVRTPFSAAQLVESLSLFDFLIRDCSDWPGLPGEWIRVSVGPADQNENLIKAFQSIFKNS